jgi:hypothetical protein
MKIKTTILALLISLNISAGNSHENAMLFFASSGWWAVGIPSLVTFNKSGVIHDWQRSGVMISISQDPTMAMQKIWDLKFKGGIKICKVHSYVAYEHAFDPVNLQAYTIGLSYQFYGARVKKLGNQFGITLKAGYETGGIKNQGQKVWTNGLVLRCELWSRKNNVGIFWEGDYFTHPELINPHIQFRKYPWLNGTYSNRIGFFWFLN